MLFLPSSVEQKNGVRNQKQQHQMQPQVQRYPLKKGGPRARTEKDRKQTKKTQRACFFSVVFPRALKKGDAE